MTELNTLIRVAAARQLDAGGLVIDPFIRTLLATHPELAKFKDEILTRGIQQIVYDELRSLSQRKPVAVAPGKFLPKVVVLKYPEMPSVRKWAQDLNRTDLDIALATRKESIAADQKALRSFQAAVNYLKPRMSATDTVGTVMRKSAQ